MQTIQRLTLLSAFAVLAGCASPPPAGPPGRHLVYRDSSGVATRQFDYPDVAFCQKVEALAGRGARCQAEPASGLTARASLRYMPPGIMVEGHYSDMSRCRTDTSALPPGVQLVAACSGARPQGAAPALDDAARIEAPPPPAAVAPAPAAPSAAAVEAPAPQQPAPPPQAAMPQQPATQQPAAAPAAATPPQRVAAPSPQVATPPAPNRSLCSAANEAAGLCTPR